VVPLGLACSSLGCHRCCSGKQLRVSLLSVSLTERLCDRDVVRIRADIVHDRARVSRNVVSNGVIAASASMVQAYSKYWSIQSLRWGWMIDTCL